MNNRINQNIKMTLSLATCLGFLMSATKCEQPAAPEGRMLKKNIKVLEVNASSFLDNSGFNFSETAQSLVPGVFAEKNYFYPRNLYPSSSDVQAIVDERYFNVQRASADKIKVQTEMVKQVKNWFPNLKSREIVLSKDSSCLFSRPQHYVVGKINSLEASSGGSLQVGFSETVTPVVPVSGRVQIDKMKMSLSFHAIDPWTNEIVTSVNESVDKTDYKVGFGVDAGIFHIGPEFYHTTGMAEVTLKGLRKAVTSLAKKLLSMENEEWSTRVILSRDNYVLLLGGSELGIKKGDRFKVFNQVHTWIGEPCGESSILNGSVINSSTDDPWIIEVEDAGKLMTKARVLNVKDNVSIDTGALVELQQFVQVVPSAPAKQ